MKKHQIITAEEAVKLVKSNDHIVIGMMGAEPQNFMRVLHTVADRVKNVTISNCLPILEADFLWILSIKNPLILVDGFIPTP